MSIAEHEMLELLKQLNKATGNMKEQIDILVQKLREAHDKGVGEGLAIGRISIASELAALSPNSFAMSKASDDNVDNSDDLYVNA